VRSVYRVQCIISVVINQFWAGKNFVADLKPMVFRFWIKQIKTQIIMVLNDQTSQLIEFKSCWRCDLRYSSETIYLIRKRPGLYASWPNHVNHPSAREFSCNEVVQRTKTKSYSCIIVNKTFTLVVIFKNDLNLFFFKSKTYLIKTFVYIR